MSEFEKKLYDMYHADTETIASTFTTWLLEHSERDHKKSVQMAGDLGAAFSKIGDLEREVETLKDLVKNGVSMYESMKDERDAMEREIPLPPPPKPEM